MIAATTNALNGALLARRPDHYRNFTIVGILLMTLLGGIGGGVTRDVMLNKAESVDTSTRHLGFRCIVRNATASTTSEVGMVVARSMV